VVFGSFLDVSDTHWAASYIYAMANNGITVGCGGGQFCPQNIVTRGQTAAFIIRALYGETFAYTLLPYFTDVPISHAFYKYVQRFKDDAITTTVGTFGVANSVARGQMAAFIIRAKYGETFPYTLVPHFTDVPETHPFFKYVQRFKDDGITTAVGTFGVDTLVTRAQIAAFIGRAFLGMP
jgi:hypothetical protein